MITLGLLLSWAGMGIYGTRLMNEAISTMTKRIYGMSREEFLVAYSDYLYPTRNIPDHKTAVIFGGNLAAYTIGMILGPFAGRHRNNTTLLSDKLDKIAKESNIKKL